MDVQAILKEFRGGKVFNKESFRQAVKAVNPDYSETAISWLLYYLRRQGVLSSVGAGKYNVVSPSEQKKNEYDYPHSQEYIDLENFISGNYPHLNFQMWELIQMNDFLNHQIAKNVIFVEVENMLVDSVYEQLHEKYPYALNQPSMDVFFKMRSPGTDIVLMKLVSEAPAAGENHSCSLEKILVDIHSKKITGQLIEKSEYPQIYEEIFRKYRIDETRMFRYAKRRNLYELIRKFIVEQTKVELKTA